MIGMLTWTPPAGIRQRSVTVESKSLFHMRVTWAAVARGSRTPEPVARRRALAAARRLRKAGVTRVVLPEDFPWEGQLEKAGVPTHFVEELSDRETLVKKVEIVPLEVIIRNVAAGSFTKRLGVPEGTVLKIPTIEFSYKNDEYHDPLINHYHALALGLATQEEIDTITKYAFQVNDILSQYLLGFNIRLIDFKLEFGRLPDGSIVLADEISPDTCRFWDATTGAHLDKDLFRRDLGGEEEAYREVMKRLLGE